MLMITLPKGLCAAAISSLFLFSCGSADFANKEDKRTAEVTGSQETAGEGECFGLYDGKGNPGQNPYQGKQPGYEPPPVHKQPVQKQPVKKQPVQKRPKVVRKPCKGPVQRPTQKPIYDTPNQGQPGCNDRCGKQPKPIKPGVEPQPWPTQRPIDKNQCGKQGKYCDGGFNNPGQHNWPGQSVGGGSYNRGDVQRCMAAFHQSGMNTKGMYGIQAKKIKNVSVFSSSHIDDYGYDANIVIINSVNVLGQTEFNLLNPNALYCIKDVSVLNEVRINSCHYGNVVIGNSVSVLSNIDTRVVQCN
jgi:hypothetical protein